MVRASWRTRPSSSAVTTGSYTNTLTVLVPAGTTNINTIQYNGAAGANQINSVGFAIRDTAIGLGAHLGRRLALHDRRQHVVEA